MPQANKAIILVRVSTEEQEEGHSLSAQTARLIEYCQRRNLEVIATYVIVESSTNGDRKKFMEMIEFAKQQVHVTAIVADAVDRVQRSFKDSVYLDELIRKEKIELHFYREGMVICKDASASDIMRWDFSVMGAKSYVLQLSENVKRSIEWKIKKGECIGPAPLGYLNKRDENGRSTVVVDPVRGPLVQRVFIEYMKGIYTLSIMARKCKEWGLRSKKNVYLGKSAIFSLIQNPFYYGEMLIKGEIHKHHYEPLITKDMYIDCKAVREGWNKKPFRYGGKSFLFRGLLTCAVTGRVISAETKTRIYVNGKATQWTYLVAWNPENPTRRMWVREDKIIGQVENILKCISYSDSKLLESALAAVQETNMLKAQWQQREFTALKKEHTDIKQKSERLLDLLAEGMISKDDYTARIKFYKERQEEITELLSNSSTIIKISKNEDILNINIYQVFKSMGLEDKKDFLNCVFRRVFT